jgi:hypothetical protein
MPRFNAPPNWPQPPQGWVPPEGWKPDPVWGAAPEGWQFWMVDAPPQAPTPASLSKRQLRELAFYGVQINGDGTITNRGQTVPMAGANARVESAGQIQSRITATRLVTTGVFAFAFKKKNDDRELYLTIEGPGFGWVVSVSPNVGMQARQFAATLNAMAYAALR